MTIRHKARGAELKAMLEALIFASPEPLTPKAMYGCSTPSRRKTCRLRSRRSSRTTSGPAGCSSSRWPAATRSSRARICTNGCAGSSTSARRRSSRCRRSRRSPSIAYKQPITALEIGEIRGVNTSGVLNTLLERHSIKIVGRKQVVGRPFLYATTKEFLIRFGLNDLSDLPKVEDMAEALGFERAVAAGRADTGRGDCCRSRSRNPT